MKIVCDSCSAKYSIADEKVAGRTFKIRCKKCGSSIVVKGDAGAAQAPAQQQAYAQENGGDAVWHVVVGNDQQGPISPAQMGELLSAGQITWDAYVWREGFDDWKPAQEIPELVNAITGGADDGGNDAYGEESTTVRPDLQAQLAHAAQQAQPRAAVRAESARPQANAGFGAFAAPAAAASQAFGAEDDIVASKPQARSPQPAGAALTGARNENSVLFSLSNLQALATGASGSASASKSVAPTSAGRAGMAQGEGSGLIDIRALASAAKAPMTSNGGGRVDDLLNLGSVGIGPTIAAPVIVPDRKSNDNNSRTILIGAAIIGVCLIGAIAVAVVFLRPQPADPVASNAIATAPLAPQIPTTAVAPATAPAAAGATAVAPAPQPTAPAPEAAAPAADNSDGRGSSGGSRRRERDRGGSTAAAAPTPAANEASGSGSRRGGGSSSLGSDLLAAMERGGSGGTARPAASASAGASSGLPETPPQADVRSALQGQQSAVAACGGGQHGVATVTITFSGSSGRVTNAVVAGQFAGTPVGSCIARAVRGASVPRFSRATLSVGYPYRI